MSKWYPLFFNPVYKDYLWGGSRIPERFHRDLPPGLYAESWELSTHPDGPTPIANGPLAGQMLSDLLPDSRDELLGTRVPGDDFPLLIKLIDARDTLSVQVHPNDRNAAAVGGDPKTEMWYFLEGDGSACVYCGLQPGVDRARFLKALENKTVADILRAVPAHKGKAVFVPGGRVHAIGAGCLILEIQQNSNTTYRIYDWDRVGAEGRPRDLHIEKALQVIDWENNADPLCRPDGPVIQSCPWFRLERLELPACGQSFATCGTSFHALFAAEGTAKLSWETGSVPIPAGQTCLLPAALGDYALQPGGGEATLLRISIP